MGSTVARTSTRLAILALLPACIWVTGAEHQARLDLLDGDGDGFVDAAAGGDDCDDSDPSIHPGAPERCTPGDEDCDGVEQIDPEDLADAVRVFVDDDEDGFGVEGTGRWVCERPPKSADKTGDCDDTNADVAPGLGESCTPYDDDCDGLINEEDPDLLATAQYYDGDGDGFGVGEPVYSCSPIDRHVETLGDCEDGDADVYPDADEDCPGFGPLRDCDPVRSCALSSEELDIVLDGVSGDDLAAGGGAMALRSGSDVGVWRLPAGALPLRWRRGSTSVIEIDKTPPDRIAIATGGGEVVIGSPDADSEQGIVYRVYNLEDYAKYDEIKTEKNKEQIGSGVAWLGGSGGRVASSRQLGSKWDLAFAAPGADRFSEGAALPSSSRSLTAHTLSGERIAVAVQVESGDGRVLLLVGSRPDALSEQVTLTPSGVTSFGRLAAPIDLGGEALVDVVAADASSTVRLYVDPSTGSAAPTSTLELEAVPSALAVGDLNGDGKDDLALGMAAGRGVVEIYLSGAVLDGHARARLEGEAGAGIGSSLAFDDIDGDGVDDLIVGAASSEQVLVLPGRGDW